MLDALRDALYGGLTRKAASIMINGRRIESFSPAELQGLIEKYEARVKTAAASRPAVGTFRKPS